jgi:Flp pilus assembly protein TadG
MAAWHRRWRPARERGASAVEFALIVPVLLMLVFGIIGFGIIFAQQLALGNSARQAARYGAVEGPTCAQIITHAQNSLANTLAMNATAVNVTVLRGSTTPLTWTGGCTDSATEICDGSAATDNVYVRAQYTSTMLVPFVQPSFNLQTVGVFRCEFA